MPLFRRSQGEGGTSAASATHGITLSSAGRVELNLGTWITNADDNFGTAIVNVGEGGGVDADPFNEWEHGGWPILTGDKLRSFSFVGRPNQLTGLTDIEYRLQYQPYPSSTRTGVGINNDAELTEPAVDIVRGTWNTRDTDPSEVIDTAALVSDRLRMRVHNGLDFEVPTDGILKLWFLGVFEGEDRGTTRLTYTGVVTGERLNVVEGVT